MTIREFWHDIRERLGDDRHPRREWREERGRDWDHSPYTHGVWDEPDRPQPWRGRDDERFRQRKRMFREGDRASASSWGGRGYPFGASGVTSASDDLGLWTGNTWSPEERSMNLNERPVDDYGVYAVRYAELDWPDRYNTTPYGVGYRGLGPQNWHRADARIREDICELMTENEDLDPSDIEVQVQDGEVMLIGSVETRQDKRLAERLAEQVSGVRDVHNRLQVHRARDTFLGTREALAGSSMGSKTRQ